tara:strand:+ start:1234 stop:2388 length:1155 start_codon:yes stop_codon:yes gene_type:complete
MLNYFNEAYPSFGLNPFISHFTLFINYLVVVTFILILKIKNYFNKSEMIILIITSSSPFFFNNFLFPWDFMYDQKRYFDYAGYIRNFGTFEDINIFFVKFLLKDSILYSSIIFAFTPIPFLNHISAIAFANKLYYISLFAFLRKYQKISKLSVYFMLFYPSLLAYTSVSLRDIIVDVTGLLALIFFLDKRFISGLIFLFICFLIKSYIALMVLIFIIGFYYFEIFLNYKEKRKYLIFVLFSVISIMLYYDSIFFDKLNFYMLNLTLEETRQSNYESIDNYFALLFNIIKNFMYSFVSYSSLNLFRTFVYIENLFIWIILIYIFIKALKSKKYIAIYWIISIFLMIGFMDTVVSNFGSLARYKFNIFFIFLIGFYYSIFIRNKNA